jgi:RNA 3'-terminal phosphate cyclase (ATP)
MIILDGSQGEGGGQILRTALTLSMITGQPFRIEKLRAGRKKPGLLRQHLTCVAAARTISGSKVTGEELLSQKLTFEPGTVKAGAYEFAIGTAGATSLVFQTVLFALLRADKPSCVRFGGGTHNTFAPTYDCLDRSFLPLVRRMGAQVTTRLERHGFYPAGAGRWQADIAPCEDLAALNLEMAGAVVSRHIRSRVANISYDIAQREGARAAEALGWPPDVIEAHTVKADGPGNVLMIEIASPNITEIFTAFGERGRPLEAVADDAVVQARDYLAVGAPVGPHLADQLLLPLALAGDGSFVTSRPTPHTKTNIEVIEKFLPVEFEMTELEQKRWRIRVVT